MSLRHALLGIVSAEPASGYDLLGYFNASVNVFWPAAQAQIYPELRRMEKDGLLKAKVAPHGKRKKRIYSVTDKGATELKRWANEPATYPPDRDQARFKTNYFDLTEFDTAQRFFETHIEHYRVMIRDVEERRAILQERTGILSRRLARRDPAEHDAIIGFREFALTGQMLRAKAEIAWAEEGLALVSRLRTARKAKTATSRGRGPSRPRPRPRGSP